MTDKEKLERLKLENEALRRHLRRHKQPEVAPKDLRHVGLHHDRLRFNPRERAFAELWAKECCAQPGTDYGFGILQNLMYRGGHFHDLMNGPVCMERITQRDAEIVATVVQWFGTNCGWCFLGQCIEKAGYRLERRKPASAERTVQR